MAKPTRELLDRLKAGEQPEVKEPSFLEKAREIGGQIWEAATPMVEHGSTELMSAIYTGAAFTPYGWGQVEPGQEQAIEVPKTPEVEPQQEQKQERDELEL